MKSAVVSYGFTTSCRRIFRSAREWQRRRHRVRAAVLGLVIWGELPHPLTLVGAVLAVGTIGLWVALLQIAPEERALSAKFGDEYEAYSRAVRRWL